MSPDACTETRRNALAALIDEAPDGVLRTDADGVIDFANAVAFEQLGPAAAAVIGQPASAVLGLGAAARPLDAAALPVGTFRCSLPQPGGTLLRLEGRGRRLSDGGWQVWLRDSPGSVLPPDALDQVIEQLPVGAVMYRQDGTVLANAPAQQLLGWSVSRVGGNQQFAGRLLDPEGNPVPQDQLPSSRVLRDGDIVAAEQFLLQRPDGERVPVLGSAAPLRDHRGFPIGGIGLFQDLTQCLQKTHDGGERQQLMESVFQILPVGLRLLDADGTVVAVNAAARGIWGESAQQVFLPPASPPNPAFESTAGAVATRATRALRQGQRSGPHLMTLNGHGGASQVILHSAVPLRVGDGRIAGAILIDEDITELHEAQQRHRDAELQLRAVFDLLPVGLWITDRAGRIILANPAGQRIWGGVHYVGPRQYGAYRGWWLQSGEPVAPGEWGLARALRGITSRSELIRIQCFDDSFKTVINWAAPIRSDTGEIIGAVAANEDVTALQHTQEQLRKAVAEREEILRVVAHDLRSPLAGLVAHAAACRLAAARMPGAEKLAASGDTIIDIARRIGGLVDDLLATAMPGNAGSMLRQASITPKRLLEQALVSVWPQASERGLRLEVADLDDLPPVQADVQRVVRVFWNILDNALKYTDRGGTITVSAKQTVTGVQYAIANSGPPVPPEQLESMFLPFWQSDRAHDGAGLGLAISRAIIEAHGGTIWAEAAEGQRLRVCFVLPFAAMAGLPGSDGPR